MRTETAAGTGTGGEAKRSRLAAGGRKGRGFLRPAVFGAVVGLGVALVAASLPRAPLARLHGSPSWAPGRRAAPSFVLRDQAGRPVSISGARGHLVLLTFMDAQCTKACPGEGRLLARVERALPAAQRPVLMVVTVNPTDTPKSARHFAEKAGLAGVAPWHWLMGTRPALEPVWARYAIGVKPTAGDIEHTTVVYLIDPKGDERAVYGLPFPPGLLVSDIRALEREGHAEWRWPWS